MLKTSSHGLTIGAVIVVASLAATIVGCERDPLPAICPVLTAGDLVISEIRGSQSGPDTYRQWVEVFNASSAAVDLEGLALAIRRLDGSGAVRLLVRSTGVTVEPGGFAVLGDFEIGTEPDYVDYGYRGDFDSDLYASAELRLEGCGTVVDDLVYRDLPTTGTWSLSGVSAPDAQRNDDQSQWCADDVEDPSDTTQLGIRGTPGENNRSCIE
ncbi:MAG: lamin tail domain-containing protein [Myxococcota bacterium]